MTVYVAMDGSVYCEQVIETAERGGDGWKPVLIFVPLRLGLESINPQYAPALVELFSLPQSVGVIGGRPKAAHFFVGVCGGDAEASRREGVVPGARKVGEPRMLNLYNMVH